MKSDQVIEAARLLDQVDKLRRFLDESPDNPESITFTFRKGRDSKSLTLRPYPLPNFDLVDIIQQLEIDTIKTLEGIGVKFD